jgi:hypothetical protein
MKMSIPTGLSAALHTLDPLQQNAFNHRSQNYMFEDRIISTDSLARSSSFRHCNSQRTHDKPTELIGDTN